MSAHPQRVRMWRRLPTNTVEGVYQHYREKHLHRFTAEYDFPYSNRVKLGAAIEGVQVLRCAVSLVSD